ncbi:MAG: hypothetical protein EOO50_07825 [Flavobacterium sp.]|uniref:hypothetical protein n=1 Tax=Flavobacterium sp. TaxID=239 RepID=UPI00120CCAEC|nr:hypothetical protein [Flavobacterium sp.]RZJ66954.1 MAG: hypothetical protein EOO50_07825 [Flavobacterium sp.]
MKRRLLDSLNSGFVFGKKFNVAQAAIGILMMLTTAFSFAQTAASATWAGTANLNAVVTGAVTGAAATQTTSYRAIVQSGSCASATSSVATITVNPAAVGGTVSDSASVCSGNNAGTLSLSGYSGTITGWESSTNNFATAGTPIANTTTSLTFTNLTVTTSYRAVISSGVCAVAYSTSATITVDVNSVWTGTNGTSWHDAGNWSCGAVPTSVVNVTIPVTTNQPIIGADAEANTLTLQSGTTLTLQSNFDFLVVGAIASQGTFTVQNNANLIQILDVNNTGNITVKRTSSALMRQDYTLWSSPVANQNLVTFSPATLATRFYTYNTLADQYNTIASPGTTTFNEAQGYLIRMPNNHPTTPTVWNGSFTGEPHNGNATIALTNGGAGLRFNAVGNPYPSAIDMNTFVADNEDDITGTLYFWRKTNNTLSPSYSSWTSGGGFVNNGESQVFDPNGIIRTGQGFFVEASATGSSVTFNNGQRVGDNANQFFRAAQDIERNRIWLNATNTSGAYSQTLVGYITGSTMGIDFSIDGKFINDGAVEFYSLIDTERYAIQGRPLPFVAADVVPMGFKATAAGQYAIAIDHVDGLFLGDQDIYLRDNVTNAVHDLKSGAYNFASEIGTFNSRFEVIYENSLAVHNPVFNANSVVVYKDDKGFVVNSGNITMASIKVYDINGRLLATIKDINASEARFNVTEANQVLLFKIFSTEDQEITKKVVN